MTENIQEIKGKEVVERNDLHKVDKNKHQLNLQSKNMVKTSIEKSKAPKELEVLTRQQKLMDLLLQGFTQEQIAEKLGVSPKTIQRDIVELRKGAVEWMENLPKGEYQIRFRKIFQQHDKIINELWDLCDNTDNEKLKLKILEAIGKMCGTKMLDSKHLFDARNQAFEGVRTRSAVELSYGIGNRTIDYNKIK